MVPRGQSGSFPLPRLEYEWRSSGGNVLDLYVPEGTTAEQVEKEIRLYYPHIDPEVEILQDRG